MLDLRNQLRKNLAKRKLNKEYLAIMCFRIIETFFDKKVKIFGYMKNGILFIKPFPNFAKNEIYLKKNLILEQINQKIDNFGYNITIQDIIIK